VETGSMLVSGAVASWLGLRDDAPLAVRYRRLSRDEQAEPGPWEPAATGPDRPAAGPARWSVQLGSFSDRAAAERYARLLDGARVDPVRTGRRTVYRVYFGRFGDRGEAEAWRDRLAGWGLEGFVKHLDG